MEKIVVSLVDPQTYSQDVLSTCGEKRAKRANQEPNTVPESGIFCGYEFLETTTPKGDVVSYPCLTVCNSQGIRVGAISVNSLLQTRALKDAYKITKKGSLYENLYGVSSERINKLSGSESSIVAQLVGKAFTLARIEENIPKLEFDEKNDNFCLHFKATKAEAMKQIQKKICNVITLLDSENVELVKADIESEK